MVESLEGRRMLAAVPKPAAVRAVDLNGDGITDAIWRNSAGQSIGSMYNATGGVSQTRVLGGDATWSVDTVGDFDRNGVSDLVWRNASTGQYVLKLMQASGSVLATASLGGDAAFRIESTGDLNGDGRTDLLWRNAATGRNQVWLMNGTAVSAAHMLGGDLSWRLVPTSADYDSNGDGCTDLLWRFSSGMTFVHRMNGGSILSTKSIGGDTNWQIVATGDFDGDGKHDIVWRHTSGIVTQWLMNDGVLVSAASLGSSSAWAPIVGVDANGDGRSDLVWRSLATGDTTLWLMNGRTVTATRTLGSGNTWRLLRNAPGRDAVMTFQSPLTSVIGGFLGTSMRQVILDQPRPVADGTPRTTVVGTFSSIDCNPGNTFTYTLVPGAGANDNDAFTISGNQLVAARSLDFETTPALSIRVRSTDRVGAAVDQTFTIAVADVNEAPVSLSLTWNAVVANQPSGSTVAALVTGDPDIGETFTCSLVAGTGADDNAAFTIVGNQLRTARVIVRDSKTSYKIRIRSVDSGGLAIERAFDIPVVGLAPETGGYTITTDLDSLGVNPWSSAVTYALPNGKVYRKVITYDSGDVSFFHFDPDNTQPWRSIAETFSASRGLDQSWTYFDDGRSVLFDADQAGVNTWNTIVDVFDSAGNLDKELLRYDDGTRTLTEIDQNNRSPFASFSQFFNAANQPERTLCSMDDGSSWSWTFDPTGTREQSRAFEAYDSRGRFDAKWSVNRGGDAAFVDDDQAAVGTWSSIVVTLDAVGRYATIQRTNDDASYRRLDLDNDASKTWTYRIYGFTADGQVASAVQCEDGGAVYSQTYNTNPTPGKRDIFDELGRLDSTVEVFADGSQRVIDYDQRGVEAWSRVTYNRAPGGALDTQSAVMDDGTRRDTDFDQANAFAWRSREEVFDATGKLDYRWTYSDDGSKVFWDVDQSGGQDFTEVTDSYDALGRFYLEIKNYRSGTVGKYEVDVSNSQVWATKFTLFDSAGRVDSVKVTNRDQSATYTKYDIANADPSVTQYTDYYNAAGLVTARETVYDNGTRARTKNDVDNAFAWAYEITAWDRNGKLDYVNTRMDDGASRNTDYDSLNENPKEAIRTYWYDPKGRITYVYVLYDDGTEWSQTL